MTTALNVITTFYGGVPSQSFMIARSILFKLQGATEAVPEKMFTPSPPVTAVIADLISAGVVERVSSPTLKDAGNNPLPTLRLVL